MSVLLTTTATDDLDLADFVGRHGTIVAEFGALTQDSGNVSWLVDVGGRRLFVKTAGYPGGLSNQGRAPYFDHAGRVALLRNAVALAESCDHPVLARLLNVVESPAGPALVYEAVDGELVHVPQDRRRDPTSAYQRLAHLPTEQLLGVFDAVIDLHVALAAAGWVAVDLYDGCLLVDFATASVRVVDLDTYRRGPSVNDMGRMFGSSTYMAPEEFERGAAIDQRTTVYTLCRLVWHFGTRLGEREADFCGPRSLLDVVRRGLEQDPAGRPSGVAAFAERWRSARASPSRPGGPV